MAASATLVRQLVIQALATKEERLLKLIVAVRKGIAAEQSLRGGNSIRGDLSQSIKTCLRKLITAGQVIESDGIYSLTPAMKTHARTAALPAT